MVRSSLLNGSILRRCATVITVSVLFSACVGTTVDADSTLSPGETFSGNYLAGRHAQTAGNMSAASTYLGAALSFAPEHTALTRTAFLVALSSGDMETAIKLAVKVAEHDSTDIFAAYTLIMDDVKNKRFDQARDRLNPLAQSSLNLYVAPLISAWTYVEEDKAVKAIETIAPLKDNPASQMLHTSHTALIHASQGDYDQAIKSFVTISEEQGGFSLRAVELLGSLYAMSGSFDKAEALYLSYAETRGEDQLVKAALARTANKSASKEAVMDASSGIAEAFFDLAGSLRQQNATETALILAQLGLYLRPDFPPLQLMTGGTLEKLDRLEDANTLYQAISISSDYSWPARLRAASNFSDLGDTEKAIKLLKKMSKENPDSSAPLIDMGDILRATEQFKEAVKAYDGAFKRLPDAGEQYWSLYYARGIALERSSTWERAERDFLQALEYQPEQPYLLNYLGYSWIEKGLNLDRAQSMIKKAVELRPTDGYIVDSLGWVYFKLGNYGEAVGELERAVELMPRDPIINDHLGDAYWQVGRKREARFQWRRALSLAPEEDQISIIQSKIDDGFSVQDAAL